MNYPLPSYAASIWLSDGTIWLGLPGTGPEDRGHSLPVPATEEGLRQVLRILQAREKEPRAKIGTAASPTRAQLEAIIRKREAYAQARQAKAERPVKAKALSADEILEQLGMI